MGMIELNSRTLKNTNQEAVNIEVIRYFLNNDNEYLIYSLNENDEAGYTKLYASKVMGNYACIITDEEEWKLIKEIIKEVVKSNRDGNPLQIVDLDENNLEGIVLQDTRVFKLQGNLVNLLSENKHVEKELEEMIEEDPIEDSIIEDSIEEEMDYEALYQLEVSKNEQLEEQIKDLEEKLVVYETKLDAIKSLLEE